MADPGQFFSRYGEQFARGQRAEGADGEPVATFRVVVSSADGQIAVTVDDSGHLVDLKLGESLRHHDGAAVAAEVLRLLQAVRATSDVVPERAKPSAQARAEAERSPGRCWSPPPNPRSSQRVARRSNRCAGGRPPPRPSRRPTRSATATTRAPRAPSARPTRPARAATCVPSSSPCRSSPPAPAATTAQPTRTARPSRGTPNPAGQSPAGNRGLPRTARRGCPCSRRPPPPGAIPRPRSGFFVRRRINHEHNARGIPRPAAARPDRETLGRPRSPPAPTSRPGRPPTLTPSTCADLLRAPLPPQVGTRCSVQRRVVSRVLKSVFRVLPAAITERASNIRL